MSAERSWQDAQDAAALPYVVAERDALAATVARVRELCDEAEQPVTYDLDDRYGSGMRLIAVSRVRSALDGPPTAHHADVIDVQEPPC